MDINETDKVINGYLVHGGFWKSFSRSIKESWVPLTMIFLVGLACVILLLKNETSYAAIGVSIFIGIYCFSLIFMHFLDVCKQGIRDRFKLDVGKPVYYSCARTRHIQYHLSSFSNEPFALVVVGGDGVFFDDPEWMDFLRDLVESRQCNIFFYLYGLVPDAFKELSEIGKYKFKEESRFKYHVINIDRIKDKKCKMIAENMRTKHAIMAVKDGENALWVSQYCPAYSKEAYECHYFDAKTLDKARWRYNFEFYFNQIKTISFMEDDNPDI